MTRKNPEMLERTTEKDAQRQGWRDEYQRFTRDAMIFRARGDHHGAAVLERKANKALEKLATYN